MSESLQALLEPPERLRPETLVVPAKSSDPSRGWPSRLAALVPREHADVYGILSSVWCVFSGIINMFLIARCFTKEVQGYYFTFGSLLVLQGFVELGFGEVIAQFASHEWSRLHLDERGVIGGDSAALSRLARLSRIALYWYGGASLLTVILLGAAGSAFFWRTSAGAIHWLAPWLSLSVLTGFQVLFSPAWCLLDGCNQVKQTYGFRLVRALALSAGLWAAMLFNANLWTSPVVAAGGLVLSAAYLAKRYGPFFLSLARVEPDRSLSWGTLWPMQWKIALSWASPFLLFELFTPVLFHYRGPAEAARMGMTWAMIGALLSVATVVITTKTPRFGMLIAQRNFAALDRLFHRTALSTLLISLAGAVAIESAVMLMNLFRLRLADRFLGPGTTLLFLLGAVMHQSIEILGSYLRAHKDEPFFITRVPGALVSAALIAFLGRWFGAEGMGISFLLVSAGMLVPNIFIFRRLRRAWHAPIGAPKNSVALIGGIK